jgi:uncharacterized integral membrane protein
LGIIFILLFFVFEVKIIKKSKFNLKRWKFQNCQILVK